MSNFTLEGSLLDLDANGMALDLAGAKVSRSLLGKVKYLDNIAGVAAIDNKSRSYAESDSFRSGIEDVYAEIQSSRGSLRNKAQAYLAANKIRCNMDMDESKNEYMASLKDIFASGARYKTKLNLAKEIVEQSEKAAANLYKLGDFDAAEKLRNSVLNKVYDFTTNNSYLQKNFESGVLKDSVLNLERAAARGMGSKNVHTLLNGVLNGDYNNGKLSLRSRRVNLERAEDILARAKGDRSFDSFYLMSDSREINSERKEILKKMELSRIKSENKAIINDVSLPTYEVAPIPASVEVVADKLSKKRVNRKNNFMTNVLDNLLFSMNMRDHLSIPNFKRRDYVTNGFGNTLDIIKDIPRTLRDIGRGFLDVSTLFLYSAVPKRKRSLRSLHRQREMR